MAKPPEPEEIVAKRRHVDVLISQGQSLPEDIRHRREFSDVFPVVAWVRRPEERSGSPDEGSGNREQAATTRGIYSSRSSG